MCQLTKNLFAGVFLDTDVLVTGHTGFKGSWLCQWLSLCGARIHGLSLGPPAGRSLFDTIGLRKSLQSDHRCDINQADQVGDIVASVQPRFVFHLAAQPLVRHSYDQPLETFSTNVLGTANVLDGLRRLASPCTTIVVTTDKCYQNNEWAHGYRESDPLGGHDPYSASKAAAEIVTASYRSSFLSGGPVRVASARAGNVIGGGDWSTDRLVPDCVKALAEKKSIAIRNRYSTRPWQHVLEPLSGYLHLAARLSTADDQAALALASAFNFGPQLAGNRTVLELVAEVTQHWPGSWHDMTDPSAVHEASLLSLSIDRAYQLLGWQPVWNFETAIEKTVQWYLADHHQQDMSQRTSQQVIDYVQSAVAARQPWAACELPESATDAVPDPAENRRVA